MAEILETSGSKVLITQGQHAGKALKNKYRGNLILLDTSSLSAAAGTGTRREPRPRMERIFLR